MPARDIIVIGASAGGVEAMTRLVRDLPGDLDAAVFVTLHFPQTGKSMLAQILDRAGSLPVVVASDGQRIEHGRVYVARPDYHLMLFPRVIRLVRGPRENGHRPSIDAMFRSAALAYGDRVIGVVLTGNLDDGTSGLLAITRRGGTAVVQDPRDALFPSMPTSAIEHARVTHVVPLAAMGPLLARLITESRSTGEAPEEAHVHDDARKEDAYAEFDLGLVSHPEEHPGEVSPYGCPECGGVLWELRDGELVRYRCRVGHAWSSDALLGRQAETLDAALWTALRALEESAALSRQIAGRMRRRGAESLAQRFDQEAELSDTRASTIRHVLLEARGDADPATSRDGFAHAHAADVSSDGQGEESPSDLPARAFEQS